MKQFIQIDDYRIININYVHSVTMNKSGEHGWVKVIDEEEKFGKYKITPEMFEVIRRILLTYESSEE